METGGWVMDGEREGQVVWEMHVGGTEGLAEGTEGQERVALGKVADSSGQLLVSREVGWEAEVSEGGSSEEVEGWEVEAT